MCWDMLAHYHKIRRHHILAINPAKPMETHAGDFLPKTYFPHGKAIPFGGLGEKCEAFLKAF